jgi:hypothetical protein
MRKVTVQVWVHALPGNPGHYEGQSGLFHHWGSELFEQTEAPSVSYTVGIVELEDGSVVSAAPAHVKFNDAPEV